MANPKKNTDKANDNPKKVQNKHFDFTNPSTKKQNADFSDSDRQRMRALGMSAPSSDKYSNAGQEYIHEKIQDMESEDPNGLPIDQLGKDDCRWPVYKTEDGEHLFCGHQLSKDANSISPYCDTHRQRAVRIGYHLKDKDSTIKQEAD